jgi:putative restriction endonuclease
MACLEDGIPIGVLRQTEKKPKAQYEVLGLAFVRNWDAGYFVLEGVQ